MTEDRGERRPPPSGSIDALGLVLGLLRLLALAGRVEEVREAVDHISLRALLGRTLHLGVG